MTVDLHTLSGVYALDALSPEEAAEFRKHLAQCPACRDEVRELREAAARMGAAEAVRPSPHLKTRIMAAADKEPQLPPTVRGIETARSLRWSPKLLSAAAAVVLIVAAGITFSQVQQDDNPTLTASVAQVFEAPDHRTKPVETANGRVVVATSAKLNEMAIDTKGLHGPSSGRVYQLWTVQEGTMRSAGVLDHVDAGKAMPMPEPGTLVAITVEPAGGSAKPTTKPFVVVDPRKV